MNSKKQNIIVALVISLLIHLVLFSLGFYFLDRGKMASPKEEIMEVDLLKDKDWSIADIPRPKFEKRPKKAKHLGVHDQTVEEEMVADSTPRAPGRPASRGGEGMDKIKESFTKSRHEERETIRLTEREKEPAQLGSFRAVPEDYYPDYKRGPHTYINVQKHMDVAYFVMLKRIFKLAWDPTHALRSHFMAGEVSRGKIRVVLGLTINKSGGLSEVFVINSSGLKRYDREAMRAVQASAPFRSPPQKFVAKDGLLRISWAFVVYL